MLWVLVGAVAVISTFVLIGGGRHTKPHQARRRRGTLPPRPATRGIATRAPIGDCPPTTACLWPDAWGSTTDAPERVTAQLTGPGEVTVRWHLRALRGDAIAGPVRHFVVGVWVTSAWHEEARRVMP
jgi:hypothetical protein